MASCETLAEEARRAIIITAEGLRAWGLCAAGETRPGGLERGEHGVQAFGGLASGLFARSREGKRMRSKAPERPMVKKPVEAVEDQV